MATKRRSPGKKRNAAKPAARSLDSFGAGSKKPAAKKAAAKSKSKKYPASRSGGGYGKGGRIDSTTTYHGTRTEVYQVYHRD